MPYKIKSIQTKLFNLPLNNPLLDSTHGLMRDFQLILTIIEDSHGNYGIGYTYTVGQNGHAILNCIKHDFTNILIDEDPQKNEFIWNKLWWASHYGGRGGPTSMAISAVDIAIWDLKAKQLNTSLWKLLGGNSNKITCYSGGIDLNLSIDELLLNTEKKLKNGFNAIKMKVGKIKLSDDLERVSEMKKFLGDDNSLMVDANMKWTLDQAITAIKKLSVYDLVWIEEPIIPDDLHGYQQIRKLTGHPIATGENFKSPWEFSNFIINDALSYPEPDITACGGVTGFMKIAHFAELYNLPVTSHGAHDLTVSLLSAVPNGKFLEIHGFGLENFIKEDLKISNGYAECKNHPGHGVEFDLDRMSQFEII